MSKNVDCYAVVEKADYRHRENETNIVFNNQTGYFCCKDAFMKRTHAELFKTTNKELL